AGPAAVPVGGRRHTAAASRGRSHATAAWRVDRRRARGRSHRGRGVAGPERGIHDRHARPSDPAHRDRRRGRRCPHAVHARGSRGGHVVTAPAGYEYFDVEADVGVRAWGRDRAEAFAHAALGVLALGVTPGDVEPRETRDVRAQAPTPADLLVAWI